MIPFAFHPEAEAEVSEAASFYESRVAGLGRSFVEAIDQSVAFIRQYPDAGLALGKSRRRLLVHGFPYAVVYRRDSESVFIVAVTHVRRRPGYWRPRE